MGMARSSGAEGAAGACGAGGSGASMGDVENTGLIEAEPVLDLGVDVIPEPLGLDLVRDASLSGRCLVRHDDTAVIRQVFVKVHHAAKQVELSRIGGVGVGAALGNGHDGEALGAERAAVDVGCFVLLSVQRVVDVPFDLVIVVTEIGRRHEFGFVWHGSS